MAAPKKLKVFRTAIGFHDAYVAAPSKKAALEAWGSTRDLFASGAAERVEDPDLMRAPLAEPGVVIRRSRGGLAEQLAALPADQPKGKRPAAEPEPSSRPTAKAAKIKGRPRPKPKPKPDRAPLDRAEEALSAAERHHADERAALDAREAELRRDRRALEKHQSGELTKLRGKRDEVRAAYDRAMKDWRG
jgi:hypothetical protein